jgi:type II secretion system protein N
MIRTLLALVLGACWFVLVFLVTFWLTFPSSAFVTRGQYHLGQITNNTYTFKATSLSPWWTGVKANDFVLVSLGSEEEKVQEELLQADVVRVGFNLPGLLFDDTTISGNVELGEAVVEYEVPLSGMFAGTPQIGELELRSDGMPLSSIAALAKTAGGDSFSGEGELDLWVKLDLSQGLGKADGRVTIEGQKLTLNLRIPDPIAGGDEVFELGPVAVDDLDINLNADNGTLKVSKGRLLSDYIHLDLDGEISLEDQWDRTRLRLKVVLSELGPEITPFAGFMSQAKWDDDKYHYNLSCRVSRLSSRCFRPERKRRNRNSSRKRTPSDASPGNLDEMKEQRERRRREQTERRKSSNSRARRPGMDDREDEEEDDRDSERLDELDDPENEGMDGNDGAEGNEPRFDGPGEELPPLNPDLQNVEEGTMPLDEPPFDRGNAQ